MKTNKIIHHFVLFSLSIGLTFGANILVMMPLPLYSHTSNYMPIVTGLAAKGHNVTMVSPFPQKKPIPNLNDIVVPDLKDKMIQSMTNGDNDKQVNFVDHDGIIFDLLGMMIFGSSASRAALECEVVQRFIKDTDSKFDLVIVETWFIQEPLIAFGHKFNAPVINIAATFIPPQTAYFTGNHLPTSSVPVMKLPYSDRMSFMERVVNALYYYWDVVVGYHYHICKQDAIMREFFKYPGSENLPPLSDLLRNTALTLMDSTFAVGYPAPLQRNIVEIGNVNVKETKKLPQDLQTFMDTAKDGVIYFSFGSHINVSAINPEIQKSIIIALGGLKQKVLMKIEDSNENLNLAKSYDNILVKSWMPQLSILAHPNCKLFITHAGVHGVMEAIHHAVPMIAIPLIADQKYNAKFIETTGIGKRLFHRQITVDVVVNAVHEVLNTPSYQVNMNKRSAIFKDTPMDPLENAIYWIEYVIRHKGAEHLRPASLDLYWFQDYMLDVLLFYLLILFVFYFVIKTIVRKFICCICKRQSSNVKKDTKKSKKE